MTKKLYLSFLSLSVFIFYSGCTQKEKVIRTKIYPQLAEAKNGIYQLGFHVEDLEARGVTVPPNLDQMFSYYPSTKKLGIKKEEWIYEYRRGVGIRMRSLRSFNGYYLERSFDGQVKESKGSPIAVQDSDNHKGTDKIPPRQ